MSAFPSLGHLVVFRVSYISTDRVFLRGRSCGSSVFPFAFFARGPGWRDSSISVVLSWRRCLFLKFSHGSVGGVSSVFRFSVSSWPFSRWLVCCFCCFLLAMCGSLGFVCLSLAPLLLLLSLAFFSLSSDLIASSSPSNIFQVLIRCFPVDGLCSFPALVCLLWLLLLRLVSAYMIPISL